MAYGVSNGHVTDDGTPKGAVRQYDRLSDPSDSLASYRIYFVNVTCQIYECNI